MQLLGDFFNDSFPLNPAWIALEIAGEIQLWLIHQKRSRPLLRRSQLEVWTLVKTSNPCALESMQGLGRVARRLLAHSIIEVFNNIQEDQPSVDHESAEISRFHRHPGTCPLPFGIAAGRSPGSASGRKRSPRLWVCTLELRTGSWPSTPKKDKKGCI